MASHKNKRKKKQMIKKFFLLVIFCVIGYLTADQSLPLAETAGYFDLDEIPEYSGHPYIEVNGNIPFFSAEDLGTDSFEYYSELDDLGRCGTAFGNLSQDTMPTEERGDIYWIKPTGWQKAMYPDLMEEGNMYNRCHLLAWCLSAENDNEKNLITGTRYMNVEGMLPFEEEVARYIDDTDHHVLYRVTPVFKGDNLVANGVLMEAYSVEDNGLGISFCVYCYNVQPGVEIDYSTGESERINS